MTIIWTIIIGFFVGLLARAVVPGNDPAGFVVTTVLGVAGALLGSLVGQGLGYYIAGEPAGFIMSILGAVIILFIYRYLALSKSVSNP